MKKTAKIITVAVCLVLTVLMCSCGTKKGGTDEPSSTSPHDSDKNYSAVFLQLDNNSDTSEIRNAFTARMRLLGYDEIKMKFDVKNADGDSEALAKNAAELQDKSYDLVVAVGEAAAKAAKAAKLTAPCIFIGVRDPVKAGLADTAEVPGGNMTGSVFANSFEALIPVMQISAPKLHSLGIVYDSTDESSKEFCENAQKLFSDSTYSVELMGAENDNALISAVNTLSSRVDALYVPDDALIRDNISEIIELCTANSKPVIASTQYAVSKGALMCICTSNEDISKAAAELADKVMQGEKISQLPVASDLELTIFMNKAASNEFGIYAPENMKNLVLF